MENKKQLTEAEIDAMFERFTNNITVGDPKDMLDYDFENDPCFKAQFEAMKEFLRKNPLPEQILKGRIIKFD